jgi:hypothetical protein
VEYELLWDQLYGSINGDTGGTWSPSNLIRVGGSGFSFAGTGHEIPSSGRVNVKSSGEIRVENSGLIRLDGTGSDISLKVTSNVPIIEVGSTGRIDVLLGGTVDVYGGVTFKNSSGPGTATWQNNTTATFQDGSEIILGSGAEMTADGGITVSSSGSIIIQSGGFIVGQSGSNVVLLGTNQLSSLALVGASTWPTLSTARTVTRPGVKIIPLTFNDAGAAGLAGGPGGPDAWERASDVSDAPSFRLATATTAGKKSIIEVVGLPIGSVLTGATIVSRGTEVGSIVSTLPTYRIISWASGLAAPTFHSNTTNDAGIALTFAVTSATTSIGVIGTTENKTVVAGRRYGIYITHPYEALSQGAWIYYASIEASLSSLQD